MSTTLKLCDSSLTSVEKKSSAVQAGEEPDSPGLGRVVEVHRREDVHQHALGEEALDRQFVGAGNTLDVGRRDRRSRSARPGRSRGRRRRRTPASGSGDRPDPREAARHRPHRSPAAPPRPACPRPPAGRSRASGESTGRRRPENSSFFVPNSRKTYGCEIPARRAISSVEAPCRPASANTASAASRISSRRIALVFRSRTAMAKC